MKIKIVAGGDREEFEEACNEASSLGYYPIDNMQMVNMSPHTGILTLYYRQQWAYFEREEERQIIKDMRLINI